MAKEKLRQNYNPGSTNRWIWYSIGAILIVFFVFRIFSTSSTNSGLFSGDKVGIVRLEGLIISSEQVNKQLNDYAERSDIKAIVLRINSGGGVVGASQEIYEKVKDLKGKVPIIVSVDNAAASGAYYAALESDMIVANHGSLVGSIGVILDYPVMTELFEKIGLHVETVKSGALKDSGSPTRPVSRADREYFQAVVDDQHDQFINAVAIGRNLPVDVVRELADGRIFTGNQALELSLIDTIGTFEDAIAIAGKIGGIKGKPKMVEVMKKRKSIFDLLYNKIQQRMRSRVGVEPAYIWQ